MDDTHATWRQIINGAIRVYMVAAEAWPKGQKFLLTDNAVIEGLDLDPDLAGAAVNGHLNGDRGPALWIIADATARVLNERMHPQLRGNAEVIAIATQQIYNELLKVAGDPLRWTYFSFPWAETNSELAMRP